MKRDTTREIRDRLKRELGLVNTLDFLAEAVQRVMRQGDRDGIVWVWHHSMSDTDRAEFDRFLCRTNDPLKWEPGTPFSRFERRVKRMIELEKLRIRNENS